jgi:hypothetical protein
MEKQRISIKVAAGTIDILQALALEHDMIVRSGGPLQGRPSVTQLLKAIASGELVLTDPKAVEDNAMGAAIPTP